MRRPAALISVAVLAVACSGVPGASPSGSSASPHPQLPSGLGEYPSGELDSPITYPPDNMWAFLSTTPGLEPRGETLAEAVEFAELIVVGRMVGVERDGGYGAPGEGVGWHAIALIEPDEVIKGTPIVEADGLIRVQFLHVIGDDTFPAKEFADLERSIPRDPAVLFLHSWASYYGRGGLEVPDWLAATIVADRYRTIAGDGHLRVVDGRVQPPAFMDDAWPAAYRGVPLQEFAALIRGAVSPP